ncbi:MAG: hypothetical protein KOO63_05775, partial [Bacteroidales bacterium]|nr:hypothetical protein [Candidatus Latescibacterota bacterium]
QVRALAHDKVDNIMWIGTLSGLAAYETGLPYPASAFRSYTTSSTSDSLGSDIITAVRPDTAANKTWIGTGEGLYLLYESSKVP